MSLTTKSNPGAYQEYKFRSMRLILSSVYHKLKKGEFAMGLRFLLTESLNRIQRKNILNKKGPNFCPICENHNGRFVHLSNKMRFNFNYSCPYCSSRPRHRALFYVYRDLIEKFEPQNTVLHFAPEPVFYSIFRHQSFNYLTSDYFLEDVDLPGQDIQNSSIESSFADVILINHVIEHVPDDMKALKELFRILKPGGKCLITIPGDFKRKETIYFNDLNYNGHYRDYGLDFTEKMSAVFDEVDLRDLAQYDEQGILAVPQNELLFIGKKLDS